MASSQVSSPVVPADASAVLPQQSYAGFGRRVAAHLIDILIAFVVMMAAGFFMQWLRVLGVWTVPSVPEGQADPLTLWQGMGGLSKLAIIVCFIVTMGPFYLGFFQSSGWQASIGKRLLNIYVIDTAGRRIGLLRSLARSFAKDFFNLFYIGLISVGTMLATSRKQAVHDFAAKTVVVNGRPPEGGAPEWWRIVAAFGIQFLWFIVTMVLVFRSLG